MKEKQELKKMIKDNQKNVIIGYSILIMLIVVIIYSMFYNKPNRIVIEAKSTKEKVVQTNELRTVTYTYNGIAKQCKNECKNDGNDTYLYFVAYNGTVTAGIDFDKLKYEIKDKNLIITIPKATMSKPKVEVGKFKYIFKNEKYNVAEELNNAYEICYKDLESRTANDELILSTAKDNAISVIKEFYNQWLEKKYPDYKLVVK